MKRDTCGQSIEQVNEVNGGVMAWCRLTGKIVTWGDCPECPLETAIAEAEKQEGNHE